MNFNEYQEIAQSTAIYPNQGSNLAYPVLGLNGEAGEVAEHAKKAIRDDAGQVTAERREKLKKELGDVLWYLSACASELGLSLSEIAQANAEKLKRRQEQGKLTGSGSDR